jgi:hypothetical protein
VPKVFSAARTGVIGRRRSAPQSVCLPVEGLESRTHLSVSHNDQGWTVITPEADSRVIYVSNSQGNDSNDGRSPEHPVKSLSRGTALIRDDSSDQLLLKRGDVWNNETFNGWWKGGKSAQEPLVIGAYGQGERPLLNTGDRSGFEAAGSKNGRIDHLSIVGIAMMANGRLPGPDFTSSKEAIGIRLLAPTKDFLVEDCYIRGYTSNIIFQAFFGDLTDLRVRRSVIVDSYSPSSQGHSQGLYAEQVTGLTLEENIFDHNGWNDDVAGGGATAFNHNVYIRADSSNVVARGNIFAHASSYGLQARAGGIIENNLFVANPIGMSFGLVNGSPAVVGDITGAVRGNVFIGSKDAAPQRQRGGWALDIGNTKKGAGTVVENNVFAGDATGTGEFPAISLGVGSYIDNFSETAGINDLTIQHNVVYNWQQGVRIGQSLRPGDAGPYGMNGVTVRDNDFQRLDAEAILHDAAYDEAAETWSNNRYNADTGRDGGGRPDITVSLRLMKWDKWKSDHEKDAHLTKVSYPEVDRTPGSYNAALGGQKSTSAFLAELRKSSSQNWRSQYTPLAAVSYIQAGYGLGGSTAVPTPASPDATPQPPVNPDPAPGGTPAVAPVATANVPEDVQLTIGDAALTFSVTYVDDTGGIDPATIGNDDIHVIGKRGFDQPATLISVQQADGNAAVATYAVTPPEGDTWQKADRGAYKLVISADSVRDNTGLPVAGSDLAQFKLTVSKPAPPAPPDLAPTVKRVKVITRGGTTSVVATFNEDVLGSIDATDLALLAEDGSRAADPAQVALAYDQQKHIATWTLPAGMAEGKYRVVLVSGGITDTAGQVLDGDKNREAGGDFVAPRLLRI